jgi:hypothetical protein
MCIAFPRQGRLRFIDAPPGLAKHFITVLGRAVREYRHHSVSGSYELKLHGYPWRPESDETMKGRMLLLKLLDGLEEDGWTVYASFNQKATLDNDTSETNTLSSFNSKNFVNRG